MSEEEKTINGLVLDLSSQAQLAEINKKLEDRILALLKSITDKNVKGKQPHRGALIVLGEFIRFDYNVPGMRQIGTNPIKGTVLRILEKGIREQFEELLNHDGAIIIDTTGQIMASQVMLQVTHVDAEVEEECSTRHIAAASFSKNDFIVSCFTMSEETGKVRHYHEGKQVYVYDPNTNDDDVQEDLLDV